MEQEYFTIIVASNSGDRERKFVISRAWIKTTLILGGAAVLLFSTASIDYLGLRDKAEIHRTLVAANLGLKEQTLLVEKRLSSMMNDLDRTHRLTTKLKIITARQNELAKLNTDLPTTSETIQVATGDDDVAERAPASEPTSLAAVNIEPSPIEVSNPTSTTFVSPVSQVSDFTPIDPSLPLSARVEGAIQEAQLREQELMDTWGALSDRQSLLSAMPSLKPAHGYYSSLFGYRFDPINGRPLLHAGLDIAAPWGTPVMAPADGVISFAGYEGGYGNLVAIDHGYGVTTRFGHNSRLFVRQGQHVHRWEVISAVGSTGKSTGAHVHYEVRVRGLPVNPANYILQEN